MSQSRILLQIDTDSQPSVFDSVVAIDAGAEHLLRHGGVTPDKVRDLVYGAMFTRSPEDLKSTAIFIGGSDVAAGERMLEAVRKLFFGPMRCSVMLDSSGANTTAVAAVLSAEKHVKLAECELLVLGGTGPVGRRVARLAARAGASVRVGSRERSKSEGVAKGLSAHLPESTISAVATFEPRELEEALDGVQVVISAGAPGAVMLQAGARSRAKSLRVAIDLNAVPPLGIEGVPSADKAKEHDGVICYGAIGVGGLKMKIHRRAIERLFEANDLVLDAEEIFELGRGLVK
jgi:methylenetetrahydrofolate/methylenetetrahydromethanopterin dehydrogenase (NADP+)